MYMNIHGIVDIGCVPNGGRGMAIASSQEGTDQDLKGDSVYFASSQFARSFKGQIKGCSSVDVL